MRHLNQTGKLSRRQSHRKALMKNMAVALLRYQRIKTTYQKAEALQSYIEPLITLAKNNLSSVAARRQIFRRLCDKDIVKLLFDELAPLFKDVPGGYTRKLNIARRTGDGAEMVLLELTKRTISDNDIIGEPKAPKEEKAKKKKAKGEVPKEKEQKKKPGKTQDKEASSETKASDKHAGVHDVVEEKKEEHFAEDVKKDKAKKEQSKVIKKGRDIFRRFRRKTID
ncbi:MAG: 50S ribosomal protein L17 [Candidatus Omnitrophica bacterium]|nr:50S ribosomal protein L17 [Candidatus Omnitrophota bacterium]